MAIVFPNEGKLALLKMILDNSLSAKVRLFTNDLTLDVDTELADFTEATFTGYAYQVPAPDGYSIEAGPQGAVDLVTLTWTCTAEITPENIRGWYLTVTITGLGVTLLLLAEKFSPYLVVEHVDDLVEFELRLLDELAD